MLEKDSTLFLRNTHKARLAFLSIATTALPNKKLLKN